MAAIVVLKTGLVFYSYQTHVTSSSMDADIDLLYVFFSALHCRVLTCGCSDELCLLTAGFKGVPELMHDFLYRITSF